MDSPRRIACALLLALSAAACAWAAAPPGAGGFTRQSPSPSAQSPALSDPVPGAPGVTYFDLLRKLFPDLSPDATARKTVPLRGLAEPRAPSPIEGEIEFDFKPYPFRSGGARLLMLWVNVRAAGANEGTPYEGEADVLAVYGLGPKPELLDALDVKTDRFTGFWEARPTLRLDARNDAFVVYSTHWNAGESFVSLDVLFVDAGRVKRVAGLFLYNTQGCGADFEETPHFRASPDPGRKYPRLLVTVRLKKGADGPECGRRARARTSYYRGVYRWNKARGRYEASPGGLDALDKFNERRVNSP